MLKVSPPAGAPVELPRPVVTAITAELRIVMREPPRPFFAHTDLLDFPGARSRQPLALGRYFAQNENALKETFLRGKVAYLFDRYVAEQELTSMLLCIGYGNQEVTTLPNMIAEWIATTHGATPEERARRRCVFFLVLTMFDMMFGEKAGSTDARSRQPLRDPHGGLAARFLRQGARLAARMDAGAGVHQLRLAAQPELQGRDDHRVRRRPRAGDPGRQAAADRRAAGRAISPCPRCAPISAIPSARSTRRCG